MRKVRLMLQMTLLMIILYMCYLCLDIGASYCFGYSSFTDWFNSGFYSARVGESVPAWSSPNYAGWACWDRSSRYKWKHLYG